MEKWQIKNANGKYVSIGMDGKPKWFESPDMGYTYTKEEAETFKVILEGLGNKDLSVTQYDKDWWKEKMNLGGKITSARITDQPKEIGDDMPKVFVTIGGKEEYLFEYYPDEISFTPEEFIGKTIEESRHLKFEKDKMYLQSHTYAGGGSLKISGVSIDVIKQGDLPIAFFEVLYELASYKHTDAGFSFFVRKSYIEEYFKDVKTDSLKNPSYGEKKKSELFFLSEIVSNMKGEILLIDNDNLVPTYAEGGPIEVFAGGGDFLVHTDLYNRTEGHNKEYHIQIVKKGNSFGVVSQWGAIGSHLRETDKGTFPTYELAEAEFLKIKKGELRKGYIEEGSGSGGGAPEPKPEPKPKFKEGQYVKLKNDANLLKVIDSSPNKNGEWTYKLKFVLSDTTAWHPESKITASQLPFKVGDSFKTSSGDKYEIVRIDSRSISEMIYKSISGIETSISIESAVRFFEEGSWKLEKDAPTLDEYKNLVGKKIKVLLNNKKSFKIYTIKAIPEKNLILLENADEIFFVNDEYFDRFILNGEGPIHEEEDLAWVELIEKDAPNEIPENKKTQKEKDIEKLSRIDYLIKYGY